MESTWDFMRSGFFILVKGRKTNESSGNISPLTGDDHSCILCRKWKLNKNGRLTT